MIILKSTINSNFSKLLWTFVVEQKKRNYQNVKGLEDLQEGENWKYLEGKPLNLYAFWHTL